MNPMALARRAEEWTDASIERAKEVFPPESAIACAKGCAHCCRLRVLVTRAEAMVVADAVRASPSAPALIARIRAAARVETSARIECPMLVDETCAVHDARPIACRAMNSLDASMCAAAARTTGARIPLYVPQLRVGETARERLAKELGAAGEDGALVDLAEALHAIFEP